MRILLLHPGKSFLPELGAYQRFLSGRGHSVDIVEEHVLTSTTGADVHYRLAGFLRQPISSAVPEIHEYASASVGRWPRAKNLVKSLASTRPAGRVFLNAVVQQQFRFADGVPFLHRDMGADEGFFAQRQVHHKPFDLVYAGSISGRPGLLACIAGLAEKGFRIALAGSANAEDQAVIAALPGVTYAGRLAPADVPAFVAQARCGLNYCPSAYPYTFQTSTKVIEYLACGLGVVSNAYDWMDRHSAQHGYAYQDLIQLQSPDDLSPWPQAILPEAQARQFEWQTLLETAGLERFIRDSVTAGNGK